MNIHDLKFLVEEHDNFNETEYDLIILELPALTSSPIPVNLLNKSYVSLLIVDANLVWARTERQLLEMYKKIALHPILTVLNKVEDDYIEDPNQEDTMISLNQTGRLLNFRRKFLSPEQG
jgi:Mrp family chromosome partitioning ATPase